LKNVQKLLKGITKIFRGGFDYPTEEGNNKVALETEMIDLQVLIDTYYKLTGIDKNSPEFIQAYNRKIDKLKDWTNVGEILNKLNDNLIGKVVSYKDTKVKIINILNGRVYYEQ
jgi:hypothetical protein